MQWLAGGIFVLEKTARNRLKFFRGCARRLVAYRQYTKFLGNRLGYFELGWCAEGHRIKVIG
jgi:hypothetical protein